MRLLTTPSFYTWERNYVTLQGTYGCSEADYPVVSCKQAGIPLHLLTFSPGSLGICHSGLLSMPRSSAHLLLETFSLILEEFSLFLSNWQVAPNAPNASLSITCSAKLIMTNPTLSYPLSTEEMNFIGSSSFIPVFF